MPPATTSTLGGVIVGNGLSVTNTGLLSVNPMSGALKQLGKILYSKLVSTGGPTLTQEIWIANYDGTNNTKVNITLPSGVVFADGLTISLSPDGTKIFFNAGTANFTSSSTICDLYSCNVDGSNVTKIIDRGGNQNSINVGGTY